MTRIRKKDVLRQPGVDYSAGERACLVKLLDRLAAYRSNGERFLAYVIEQEIKSAALTYGHGATGESLSVAIMHREDGTPYAVIGGRRGDS